MNAFFVLWRSGITLLLIMVGVIFFSVGTALAQEIPYPVMNEIFYDEDNDDVLSADVNNDRSENSEADPYSLLLDNAVRSNIPENQYWEKFRQYFDAKITLTYQYAYQVGHPVRTVLNRSALRLELDRLLAERYFVKLEGKFTAMGPGDHLVRARDDAFRMDAVLNDGYLEWHANQMTFKIGQQRLIWGEAETAVVTDLVSPRDISELNYKSLEDSRVSQPLLVASYYDAQAVHEFFINPYPGTDVYPEAGSEYFVSVSDSQVAQLKEEKPEFGEIEYGLRWRRTLGQSDIALMAADLKENQPVKTFQAFTDTGEKKFAKVYKRFKMIGATGTLSQGNAIFKAEIAYSWNRPYQCGDQTTQRDTIDVMVGSEFSSTSRLWNFTLEAANKHIRHWDDALNHNRRDELCVAGIASRQFLNETLKIEYTLLAQLRSGDTFQRLRVEYDLTDNLTGLIEFGGFTSRDEEGAYWQYRKKQRVLAILKLQI